MNKKALVIGFTKGIGSTINQKMTGDDLQRTIFTYPSWVDDVKSMV